MKKNDKNTEEEGGKWLSTFNDMVTLLLTFFVLILSLSTPDTAKLIEVAKSLSTAFGMFESGKNTDGIVFTPFVIKRRNKVTSVFEKNKTNLGGRVEKTIHSIAGLEKSSVDVIVIKEGVSVILGEKLLFKSGMAEIEKKNYHVLNTVLGLIFKEIGCQVRVEGHTDEVPISNERFSSNWELSIARATNIVRYFISEGGLSGERFSATGYADSKPLFPESDEQSKALNRRVEIILTLKKG
jgi:chemotaxis protein MotB